MASKQRNLIWRNISVGGNVSSPFITVEVWHEPTPEDPYASYIDFSMAFPAGNSVTYRMHEHDTEELIACLEKALDCSRQI